MKSQSMSVAQTIQKERKIQWNSTYNVQLKTTDSKAFVWTGQSWATFWRLQGWFQVSWGRMEGSSMRRGRRRQKPEGQASRWDIVECRVHPPLRTEDSIDPEWLRPGCSVRRGSAERDRFDNRRRTRIVCTWSARQHRASEVDPWSRSWRDPCTATAGPVEQRPSKHRADDSAEFPRCRPADCCITLHPLFHRLRYKTY